MKQTCTVQGSSQMTGEEAESEAETDERNVGTLRTDDPLAGSRLRLFITRYDAVTVVRNEIHDEIPEPIILSVHSIKGFG